MGLCTTNAAFGNSSTRRTRPSAGSSRGPSPLSCRTAATVVPCSRATLCTVWPFLTFASTTHAIVRCGCTPVFCDIDPETYTLDSNKLEALITDKTVAILPIHVYGNLCDVDAIARIAEKPQAFFNHALEGDLLLVGFKADRREKPHEILAHQTLEVFHPDFGALVILRDNENRVRLLEKALRHHHGGKRDRRPIHMDGFAPRIRKMRK